MMNAPYFSVVILAWQVEKYIEECLKSVTAQTFQDFEAIIIAPPCEDRSTEICDAFAKDDPRFKVFKPENRGQNLNRKEGWEQAEGEYVLFLDGDDLLKPELLETMYSELQKNAGDMVIFGYETFGEGKNEKNAIGVFPSGSVFKGTEKTQIYEKFVQNGPFNGICGKCIRRILLKKVDVESISALRNGEDLLLNCMLTTEADSVCYVSAPLYQYRVHGEGISRSMREQEIKDIFFARGKVKEFMSLWDLDDEPHREIFYRSTAAYTADWIYRCAVSGLPWSKKQELYHWLKEETELYSKIKPYFGQIPIASRPGKCVELFERNSPFLRTYAFLCRGGRTLYRHMKNRG